MLVQCPKCQTTYRVADTLITAPNPAFRCSRCKHTFILASKSPPSAAREPAKPPPAAPRPEPEPEFNFSPAAPERTESAEEKAAELPAPPAAQGEEKPAMPPAAQPSAPTMPARDDSFSVSDDKEPEPGALPDDPSPRFEPARASLQSEEKEERWSLASEVEEKSFIIPEESLSEPAASAAASSPALEAAWSESLPLLHERQADPSQGAHLDRPLSLVPYISLFGALLLLYALLALMHQAQPKTIEAAIRAIPWFGPTVMKNDHLRHGVVLESLRPGFQAIQGNREVFVLSGLAINRNPVSAREVRVEGIIFNAEGKEIDRQIISVGNAISSKILRDLTPQEISILQRLNPQKRFEIPPDGSAPFVIVFLKASSEVKNFSCRVVSVEEGV